MTDAGVMAWLKLTLEALGCFGLVSIGRTPIANQAYPWALLTPTAFKQVVDDAELDQVVRELTIACQIAVSNPDGGEAITQLSDLSDQVVQAVLNGGPEDYLPGLSSVADGAYTSISDVQTTTLSVSISYLRSFAATPLTGQGEYYLPEYFSALGGGYPGHL